MNSAKDLIYNTVQILRMCLEKVWNFATYHSDKNTPD